MKRATGFALLTPERRREVAALGGKTAHANGTAPKFEKGSEEARLAGRKGGEARRHKYEAALKKSPKAIPQKLINGDWSTK